jgi:hypothetical protein
VVDDREDLPSLPELKFLEMVRYVLNAFDYSEKKIFQRTVDASFPTPAPLAHNPPRMGLGSNAKFSPVI